MKKCRMECAEKMFSKQKCIENNLRFPECSVARDKK